MGDISPVSQDVQLRDLQVFVAVVSTGSFRGAASRLYTSQPAVTRSIARLEGVLKRSLLERGPRGARPTPAGEALLVKARRVLNLTAEMQAEHFDLTKTTLRLGTAATAAGSFLAQFLAGWIPSHPDVRVQVLEDGALRLRRRLEDGEVDIAIIAPPIPVTLEARPIRRVGVCAHFPASHPLNQQTGPLPIAELAPYPLLLNQPTFISAQVVSEQFERVGVRPQVLYESTVAQTLAALAEAGMGVAVFSDSVDLRATTLCRRPLIDPQGQQVGFDLHVGWRRHDTPEWIRELGRDLSAFTTSRFLPYQPGDR